MYALFHPPHIHSSTQEEVRNFFYYTLAQLLYGFIQMKKSKKTRIRMELKVTQLRVKKGKTGETALTTLPIEKFIEKTRTEGNMHPVSRFRETLRFLLPDEKSREADKLPRILPAAEFTRTNGLMRMKRYNGIVELTVGPLSGREEKELVKRRALEVPQTRCIFTGSSGRTVKIWTTFIRPDHTLPENREDAEIFHAYAYRMAVKCYQPQLPFAILHKEPRLEQSSRLSFDPELIYRPEAVPFYLSQPLGMPDIADYRETLRAETSPFMRTVPGTDTEWTASQLFEAALRKAYEDIGEATALGAIPTQELQPLITQLGLRCFQSGIPQEEAVHQTIFHFYTHRQEALIRQIINNVYTEQKGFGKQKCLSKEQKLTFQMEEFMKRRYEFRHNTQLGEVEYRRRNSFYFRFEPVDKRVLNSIALDAQSEGIPLWDKDVNRYVYSDRVPKFDPLEDFLYTLPRWDGRDRIGELARRVPCLNPHWEKLFHRWFLSMVSHWRRANKQYANSVSPLLVGPQGCHKSTFCRNLLPEELRSYYTDSINFAQKKDAELSLNRFALINIDEFDQISATQQGFLKHILQKPVVSIRKPHAKATIEMRRYASFIATSNQKCLLTDPTGSRRFICIELKGLIDTEKPIDYKQLYAQATHELHQGERCWFSADEERIMTEYNREFELLTAEEQLFFRYFRPVAAEEEGEWLLSAEIMQMIQKKTALPLSGHRFIVFGKILQKHKVPSKHTRAGTAYHVVRV